MNEWLQEKKGRDTKGWELKMRDQHEEKEKIWKEADVAEKREYVSENQRLTEVEESENGRKISLRSLRY